MYEARRLELLALAGAALGLLPVSGCSGCSKSDPAPTSTTSARPSAVASATATVVAESLPRCRIDGARLAVPGEDVVVGEAVVSSDALLVGVVRREGNKRFASIVRASLDLGSITVVDVGPSLGDDPPPAPRLRGTGAMVTSFARKPADGGAAGTRSLDVARIEKNVLVAEGSIVQQADESLAYDVAWPEGEKGAGLVAWDEDAPPEVAQALGDRGVIKVQLLGAGTKPRIASPTNADAEAPRLLARPGGFWLAWLARRAEAAEDAGANGAPEGPGERRSYRWVELVSLDAKGEPTSAVRRVSPEKGRAASFELARFGGGTDGQLVVLVQDEAAHAEGAGERIVRYAIDGEKTDSADLLDGGVGHALADLLPPSGANRWLAFTDTQEHAHLILLGPALRISGANTMEPALDGTRVLGTSPPDALYAIGPAGAGDSATGRVELRRLICR